jgi:hypothetical protein
MFSNSSMRAHESNSDLQGISRQFRSLAEYLQHDLEISAHREVKSSCHKTRGWVIRDRIPNVAAISPTSRRLVGSIYCPTSTLIEFYFK